MNKYEVLLFDLDDTLIDNLENVRHAYTKMVESVREDYTEEGFKKWYDLDKKFWIDFHEKNLRSDQNLSSMRNASRALR